ncbi:hypothetical protein EC968_003029 [Mortierella alpina]|nr:hypothetical protein EC968_003029 [Mortierella alpina]
MDGGSLSTGAIIGIVFGSVLGFAGLVYLCCYRKQVAARQTQKLMDATNLIHAQHPQGTLSHQVLPDGSIGVFVRPMPSTTHLMGQPSSQYPVQRPLPPPPPIEPDMFQQLPYNPQGLAAIPSSLALSSTFAQPSAPVQPEAQLQLQFSSHPRPNVVTTIGDEIKEGVVEEAKGDPEGEAWDDTSFIPPPTGLVVAPLLTPSPLATGVSHSPSSSLFITSTAHSPTPATSTGVGPGSEPEALPAQNVRGPQTPAHASADDPTSPSIPSSTRPNASSFKTSPPEARNPHEVQADVVITMPSLDNGRVYPMDQDLLPPRPAHNPHATVTHIKTLERPHNTFTPPPITTTDNNNSTLFHKKRSTQSILKHTTTTMTERMSNTIKSAVGGAKQSIGEAIGNPEMAASGAAQKTQADMAQRLADKKTQAEGVGHRVEGQAQEKVGDLTNDKVLKARGLENQALGDIELNV